MSLRLNIKNYLTVWLFFIFITSFVVTNTIKGTIPAFILSILSVPIVLILFPKRRDSYMIVLSLLIFVYTISQVFSQAFLLLIEPPNFDNLILVSGETRVFARTSLFTQSLYLICSFFTFAFISNYYDKKVHDRYLSLSLISFVAIGAYFWIFYLLFNFNGDFISNREYSGGLINPGQFQPILVAGTWITRFVSLTGEPSMYVYSVMPFFIYMVHVGHSKTAFCLFISLVLTLSGTFVISLFLYAVSLSIFAFDKRRLIYFAVCILLTFVIFLGSTTFREIIYNVLLSKILQESDSGLDRFASFFKHVSYFFSLPIPLMMTGMGFGFIRSPDFGSTLLVNMGLLGFTLFSVLILYPVYKLPKHSNRSVGIKCALLITYIIMLTSVSEYSYPSLWLLLGIAYSDLNIASKIMSVRISFK